MEKIGSSETIRKTTLDFSLYKQNSVQHKKKTDNSFLEWFVGFAEGSGTFIVSKERLFFIINQKEEKVLHYIRTNLGFGKVSTYKSCSRYIVADKTNIDRLIFLFNGNLILNKTNNHFFLWLNSRDLYSKEKIPLLSPIGLGGIEKGGWLSGFIDAKGCFNARFVRNNRYTLGFRVHLRFLLDQKDEKETLQGVKSFLKSGFVSGKGEKERYTIEENSGFHLLISFLKKHPLRTLKKVDFLRWASLLRYIENKETLPWKGKVLRRVCRLVKNINKKS